MTSTNFDIELIPGAVKEATAGMKSNDLWVVPYDSIELIEGYNVRVHGDDYEAHINYLTGSMVANGYIRSEPMTGYVANVDGVPRIKLVKGYSRHAAVARAREQGAQIETVTMIMTPRGTSMEDLTVDLVTSNSGRPLTPYEIGIVIKRLMGYGWDEAKVAKKLGFSGQYVSDLLTLQEAPKAVRDMVAKGSVSATTAIQTVKKHGKDATSVLQDAVETAKASGKTKASTKHIKRDWKTECRKNGTELYEALMWAVEDPNFSKLTQETQDFLNAMVKRLPPEPEKKLPKEPKAKPAKKGGIAKAIAKATTKKVQK